MQVIGILGGTFNPIHLGHLYVAQQALQRLQLDQVRFIPAAIPALKQSPSVTGEQRAEMVSMAIQDHPLYVLDRRELDRPGVSYSIDTLQSLRQELGAKISLIWLMGSDAFANIQQWHQWQDLLALCHIAVVMRPNSQSESPLSPQAQALLQQHQVFEKQKLHASPNGKILCLEIAAPDISSSSIRHHIAHHQAFQHLVPEIIADYIQRKHLYQSP